MSRSFPLFSWGLGPGACAAIRVLLLLSRVPWFPSSPVSRVPFPVGLVADGWCLWAMLGMRPRSRSGRGGEASQASNTTAGAKDSCPDVRRPRRNRPHAAAAAVGDPEQRPNRGERPRRSATAGAETLGLGMLGFDWRGTGQTKIIVPAGKGTILGGVIFRGYSRYLDPKLTTSQFFSVSHFHGTARLSLEYEDEHSARCARLN